jgi:sugar lactone lactonase YvrE
MATTQYRLLAAVVFSAALASCGGSTTSPPPDDQPAAVGTITTWAGTGAQGFNGENVPRQKAQLYWPNDIEFTPNLGPFIVDWNNHRIRGVGADGRVNTVIGTNSIGDGPPAPNVGDDVGPPGWPGHECDLNHPTQVLERGNGKLLIVCWHNHKLREWDPATGREVVIMGRGAGCTGDGLQASDPAALLNQQAHAVEAPDGSLYINDQRNQCIRKIDPAGVVSTVAGTKVCDLSPGGFSGDGGDPLLAQINQPTGPNPNPPGGGLALDDQGRLYISDTLNHRIRRVDFNANVINTVVGNGTPAYAGDGGDPLQASLNTPLDICFGPDGRLYIADAYNHAIRAVDFDTNVIVTVAGTGVRGYSGDGGPATSAKLALPYGLGFDADGHLYIADTYNNRIRRVKMHD